MHARWNRVCRWTLAACAAATLAACGGGGGGGGSSSAGSGSVSPLPAPAPPDTRNGTYTMVAADAREYTLALDFDAKTYRVTGTGVDQGGAIQADGAAFDFLPGNATGATGVTTTRFSYGADTVVGEYVLPTGALPFIASRTFATTLPTTTTTFTMLGRTVDTSSGAANTTTQQGQVTSDGRILTCDDPAIFEIGNCPAASTTTGTLSISGSVITAATSTGNVPYRIATVGPDRVLLRASQSLGTTRQFVIGLPASTTFTGGTFVGGTTEPAWGSATVSTTAFSTTGTSPTGVTTTRSGTAAAQGAASLGSLLFLTTTAAGNFFSASSAQLGVVVATPGSASARGFMAIGLRQ